jgi:hypothetical protein
MRSPLAARIWIAAAIACGLFYFFFHPLVPLALRYRNQHDMAPQWSFAILFAAGFGLTFGLARGRYWICHTLVLTVSLCNAILIALDWQTDPTSHNLFPFEFLMIGLIAVPAYLGAMLSHLAHMARKWQRRRAPARAASSPAKEF